MSVGCACCAPPRVAIIMNSYYYEQLLLRVAIIMNSYYYKQSRHWAYSGGAHHQRASGRAAAAPSGGGTLAPDAGDSYMYIYIYIYVCICIYIYIYIYTYIYTHTFMHLWSFNPQGRLDGQIPRAQPAPTPPMPLGCDHNFLWRLLGRTRT